MNRRILFIQCFQQLCETRHCSAFDGHRAVTALSAHSGFDRTDLFLRDHDRIEALPAKVQAESTELADRITDVFEQFGMLFNEKFRAIVPALLAGNCVLFKPSKEAALTGQCLGEIFEENLPADLARTVAAEIGVGTASLDPMESPSKDQLAAGESYLSAMSANLAALRTGLGCS